MNHNSIWDNKRQSITLVKIISNELSTALSSDLLARISHEKWRTSKQHCVGEILQQFSQLKIVILYYKLISFFSSLKIRFLREKSVEKLMTMMTLFISRERRRKKKNRFCRKVLKQNEVVWEKKFIRRREDIFIFLFSIFLAIGFDLKWMENHIKKVFSVRNKKAIKIIKRNKSPPPTSTQHKH